MCIHFGDTLYMSSLSPSMILSSPPLTSGNSCVRLVNDLLKGMSHKFPSYSWTLRWAELRLNLEMLLWKLHPSHYISDTPLSATPVWGSPLCRWLCPGFSHLNSACRATGWVLGPVGRCMEISAWAEPGSHLGVSNMHLGWARQGAASKLGNALVRRKKGQHRRKGVF